MAITKTYLWSVKAISLGFVSHSILAGTQGVQHSPDKAAVLRGQIALMTARAAKGQADGKV